LASELRWILLGLSALLLLGIWWWGLRRASRQSPGNAHLRETHPGLSMPGPAAKGDWGVPPLEPLSIRTANFDPVPVLDMPMSATLEPLDVTLDDVTLNTIEPMAAPLREPPVLTEVVSTELGLRGEPVAPTAPLPADASTAAAATPAPAPAPLPAAPAPAANTSENQRIVTIRVCAVGDTHWSGALLLSTLENHGLVYGRYKVFHRKHSDGRTLFCAASLVEPGTFDIERMPDAEFRGVTLFAVLPGPADALETIDTLIETALELAQTLHGAVQDAAGAPLSAQRALALREDVAHFQRSLSMS
jgi:cell division protein ZipA